MKNYLIIIQARTGSKRFPKKIIKKIDGKTIIEILLDRLNKNFKKEKIIIATTKSKKDDILCNIAKKKGIKYFRGSENNVMSRFIQIGKIYELDFMIRITSDCPLIDPKLVSKMLNFFLVKKIDYLSNTLPFEKKTFPDGSDIEVFKYESLLNSSQSTKRNELEHVTNQLWKNKKFKRKIFRQSKNLSKYRYSLDYKSDLFVIKKIFYFLKKNKLVGTANQIANFLSKNQLLLKIGKKNLENYLKNKSIKL